MEYQFVKVSNIIAIFVICTTILGIILYNKTKKINEKDKQIKTYGIFMGMKNIDIIMLSLINIEFITVCNAAISKNIDIKLYSTIIIIISTLFIIYKFKTIINQSINIAVQIIALYLNKIIYQYRIEVEKTPIVNLIQQVLTILIIMYAIYAFLIQLEEIIKTKKQKQKNKKPKNKEEKS